MPKEQSYIAKLLEQPLSILDGSIQDYKKAKKDIENLKSKKSETNKTLSEQKDAISKMEKANLDSDIRKILIADNYSKAYSLEKYWRNMFLIGGFIPSILNIAYHYLSGQMPESLNFSGLAEIAYGGGDFASVASKIGTAASLYESVCFQVFSLSEKKGYKEYSGVDLTKENSEKVRERAEYIRKNLEEK